MTGKLNARLVGVELYSDDLNRGKRFYGDTLGLQLSEEGPGRYAKFDGGQAFVCLERKGSEPYPSQDKAVLFLEVADLAAAVAAIGKERFIDVHARADDSSRAWGVLHDPEGYNVVILEAPSPPTLAD